MATESFYNELDLRYPELAYNKTPINRANPGLVPFYIPALYPNLNGGAELQNTVQQNNRNLMNKEKPNIGNIVVTNYIYIKVPKELCGYINGNYNVKGNLSISSSNSASGSLKLNAIDDPTIPKDSAWIVIFLGGDINKPVIISRCYL